MTLFSQTKSPRNAYWDDLAFNEWFQPDNIKVYDTDPAFFNVEPSNLTSDLLRGNNFGFTLPLNASVSGILLVMYKKGTDGAGTEIEIFDQTVSIYFDVNSSGDNKADTGTAWNKYQFAHKAYGASNDLWTIPGLTPADINSSGFGFGIIAEGGVTGALGQGSIDFAQITVYYTAGPESGVLPLYINGSVPVSGNIPIFIEGRSNTSGIIPLFLQSNPSGNLPLYLLGHIQETGLIPLYLHNFSIASGNVLLFLKTIDEINGSIPLYLQTGEIDYSTSGNFPLSIHGTSTGTSGLFQTLPLFLQSDNFPGSIPLYIQAPDTGASEGGIPLYLSGSANFSYATIPLFICQSGVAGSVPLYIQGASTSLFLNPSFPNAGLNATGVMPLFIQRDPADMIPLFLCCNLQSSGVIPLYNFGHGVGSGVLPLFLASGIASSASSLRLFIRGRS